jgi:hypothetical protein
MSMEERMRALARVAMTAMAKKWSFMPMLV